MDVALAKPDEAPPPRPGTWLEHLVPPVDRPSKRWHVSPFVDLVAYQLSWIWILVPLTLLQANHPRDYLVLWAFAISVSATHRHYTMPYVYLDRQVFSQHVTRFGLFMFLLMLGFLASSLGWNWLAAPGFLRPVDAAFAVAGLALVAQAVSADRRQHRFGPAALVTIALPFSALVPLGLAGVFSSPSHVKTTALLAVVFALVSVAVARDVRKGTSDRARKVAYVFPAVASLAAVAGCASLAVADVPLNGEPVSGAALVGVVGAIAAIWNIWHTLMQKFGIMRMYAAKSDVPVAERTPAWADRLLVFGAFPFIALYIAPAERGFVAGLYRSITQFLLPLVDGLIAARPVALPVAGILAGASVGIFAWYEWRANRLRSWPRVAMGSSLVALAVCFLFLDPVKVYLAYGFSHAVEYCVFVWAFMRRRYAKPLPSPPLLQRALRHPWLAYGLFTLAIGGTDFALDPGREFGLSWGRVHVYDVSLATWLFAFTIWHSMGHFYFDGFLWKMRTPEVRANI